MARIELASLGAGVAQNPAGAVVAGVPGTITLHGSTTPVSIYPDETTTSFTSGTFTTDSFGRVPGWVDQGQVIDITIAPATPITVNLVNVSAGATVPAWTTGTSYITGQQVGFNNQIYGATSSFTSGVSFPADVLLQRWELIGTNQGIIVADTVQSQSALAIGTGNYHGLPSTTIDNVTVTAGMIVQLTAEPLGINNGPWVVASGNWTRPPGYETGSPATGKIIYVKGNNGISLNAGSFWAVQGLGPYTVDTDATAWHEITKEFQDRGFVNPFSLYYKNDVVTIPSLEARVVILEPCQATNLATFSNFQYTILQRLQVYNALDYGAVGDATTDSTTAIQNCINAAANSGAATGNPGIGTSAPGLGGIAEIPHGTFRTSATLDLPSNVWLRGRGWSATVIQLLPQSNCHIITTHISTGGGNSNAYWSRVSDIMLDGRQANQGTVLSDCTIIPGTNTIVSTAGTFPANNTVLTGIGTSAQTVISSGGGTGTATISNPLTFAALQQPPGASTIYCGGTVDAAGAPVPWAGIYHETNPYTAVRFGADNQFDPTHLFSDIRIYFMQGTGIQIHGRSDVVVRRVKVSFPTGNGFQTDFDTLITESMVEKAEQNGWFLAGHSSNRVTSNKFYNCYEHGMKIVGVVAAGEITLTGNDNQQHNLDGLHVESMGSVHHAGVISQSGFINVTSTQPSIATSWTASHVYYSFRMSGNTQMLLGINGGYTFAVYTPGFSGGSAPTWPTSIGQTVTESAVSAGSTSANLSTASPITSIPVNALTGAVPAGTMILSSGGFAQAFTTTGASINATSIPVSSATPNFPYPSGSVINPPASWVCVATPAASLLPASVSLINSSNNVIEGTTTTDLFGLRITGTSSKNTIILGHASAITNSADITPESLTVTATTNKVIINGTDRTAAISQMNDFSGTPSNSQLLGWNSTTSKWSPTFIDGGASS